MGAPRIFFRRLKIGFLRLKIWRSKFWDLNICRSEDSFILSFFTPDIWCSRLMIWIQHILNLKIQNLLICAGCLIMPLCLQDAGMLENLSNLRSVKFQQLRICLMIITNLIQKAPHKCNRQEIPLLLVGHCSSEAYWTSQINLGSTI